MTKHFAIAAGLATLLAGTAQAALLQGTASLDYFQEVDPSNPEPSDATGAAELFIDTVAGTIDILVEVEGINVSDIQFPSGTLSFDEAGPFHIHNAPAGVNGPIVVAFNDPTFFSDTTDGMVIAAEDVPFAPSLVDPFLAGDLYFNLHTLDYASGEIRGQIAFVPLPAGGVMLLTALGAGALVARRRA